MFVFILFKVCVFSSIFLAFNQFPRISKRQDIHQTFSVDLHICLCPPRFKFFVCSPPIPRVIFNQFLKRCEALPVALACLRFMSIQFLIKQWTNKQLRRFSHVFLLSYLQTDVFHIPLSSYESLPMSPLDLVYDTKWVLLLKC